MARDLRRELDEQHEDDARTWKPAVNDELIGRVVRRDQIPSKFNPDTPTERLVIQTDDDEQWTVYCNHIVLRNKILTLNPQVGDRIAIRRRGDEPDKHYARYKVIVDRIAHHVVPSDPDDSISF